LKLRGYLALGVIGSALVLGDPIQRTVVAGLARLFPSRRDAILTAWIRMYARIVLGSTHYVGGARVQEPPTIPGAPGVLVLMNHQSVLDIPLVVKSLPLHPRIVTRERYRTGKPLISHMIRLYQYPVVQPAATGRAELKELAKSVAESPVPIVIYPEGTRTKDGNMSGWREGGLRAILSARPWTVYLMVSDGHWQSGRVADFVKNVSESEVRSTVVGPFVWSDPDADPDAFIVDMRTRMVAALATLRSGPTAA
jgi:1-acyl-sn-glycerol-3-phosphate acyltransferase